MQVGRNLSETRILLCTPIPEHKREIRNVQISIDYTLMDWMKENVNECIEVVMKKNTSTMFVKTFPDR
jgi:hypothetical protein